MWASELLAVLLEVDDFVFDVLLMISLQLFQMFLVRLFLLNHIFRIEKIYDKFCLMLHNTSEYLFLYIVSF